MGLARTRWAWELLYRSGLSRAIGLRSAGLGAIFLFHRVVPDVSARIDGELCVGAGFLEAWLASLRRARVPVVSLDDAARRILDPPGAASPSRRRFVVVTFDDGYADNVEHAVPVLERFGAPFTVYVTTGLVEGGGGGAGLWWLALERLVRRRDSVDVAPMGRRFAASTRAEKAEALGEVSRWVGADVARRAPLLGEVFERYGVSAGAAADEAGLSRAQLRALARHPLATLGGHTTGHPDLTGLGEPEAYRELSGNKAFLEDLCGRPVEHFAYPYGACGAREAALAGKAGFRTAVTSRPGGLFPEHRSRLLLLPRYAAPGSRTWLSFLHARRHGVRRLRFARRGRGGGPAGAP